MSLPLITVIIPTYNRVQLVVRAVNSVLAQTYRNTEIIVVDDGSVDGTGQAIAEMFADSGVKYFFQQNKGQAAARNHGLQYAQGQFVATLDSDDAWYPEFLQKCFDALQSGSYGFVFANWLQQATTGAPYPFLQSHLHIRRFFPDNRDVNKWIALSNAELRDIYIHGCPSPSSSLLVRREMMGNGWDEHMMIGDDWSFLLDVILIRHATAIFTFDVLWAKSLDSKNIYDGEGHYTIIEKLFVNDASRILERVRYLLDKDEIKILQNRIGAGLLMLMKDAVKTKSKEKVVWLLKKYYLSHAKNVKYIVNSLVSKLLK